MDSGNTIPDSMYISRSLLWANAVVKQGDRVLELLKMQASSRELFMHGSDEDIRALNEILDTAPAEEHFFLIATGKLHDWLTPALDKGLVDAGKISGLMCYTGVVTDARNMREHDDEYFIGKGNKKAQPRFVQDAMVGNVPTNSDASCSGGSLDAWYVGHHVNMNDIMKQAADVAAYLRLRLSEVQRAKRLL